MMSPVKVRPTGHLQIKRERGGRARAYYVYWRDAAGRHGQRLGPAHVKDSGRRTARGAVIWRAGDGPKPTPEHLTPREAEAALERILADAAKRTASPSGSGAACLRDALEGWVAERRAKDRIRRRTARVYEDICERLCRDLDGQTPLPDLADGRLRSYFAELTVERALGRKAAERARSEGLEVVEVQIESLTAQPPGSRAVEVATKAEAIRLAAEMNGTWKHRRRGAYRVVPCGAERKRRVSHGTAKRLEAEGWLIERRITKRWAIFSPASAETHNKYRALLGAALDYAIAQGWLAENPIKHVDTASTRAQRMRVLRRDDFYNPHEVGRLLEHAPSIFERAFWLCGAHAGLRLPGEALGLTWGAVDFQAGVIRPYGNWVGNAADQTKTAQFTPIPMTARLSGALAQIKCRDFATGDDDYVFVADLRGRPVDPSRLRDAFKQSRDEAGLKPIPMYNLRHSFGTTLAADGIDIRTIQALMRHTRLSTTEQYMAYAPQPDLADRLARALDPNAHTPPQPAFPDPAPTRAPPLADAFIERLEEEIPAKWMREVQRLYAESQVTSSI